MLGKLARYLRMLGFDTEYPDVGDDASLVAGARREGRILLTRDRGIEDRESVRRCEPRAVHIASDKAAEQLTQLRAEGWLERPGQPRCPLSNTLLVHMPFQLARHLVHPFTASTQEVFLYCPRCNSVFWSGSHLSRFRKLLAGAEVEPPTGK